MRVLHPALPSQERLASASFCCLLTQPSDCVGVSGNWIEIAYGTSSGAVRVIVQHPETVGSGPQLFQTFTVHRSPVTKIMLSEKHLVSGNVTVLGLPVEGYLVQLTLELLCETFFFLFFICDMFCENPWD